MPKIMFRPNPTPPPFVPPQPTYDGTMYIKINPFNFEMGIAVTINIQQGNFPPFSFFEIGYGTEQLHFSDYAIAGQFTSDQIGLNIQRNAMVDKSDFPYYTALFELLDGGEYRCNIIFQEF
jgi:hypothetical protein